MKTRRMQFLAVLLMLALVQFSCSEYEFLPDDRTSRERDRDDCEERGGIWHDIGQLGPWCEYPPEVTSPDKGSTPAETPVVATPTPVYDISRCDARDAVSVEITLDHDETSRGSRYCWYTLRATNNSDTTIAFYVYENRLSNIESRWWLMYLDPGETRDLGGNYSQVGVERQYCYLERAAAVYYNDYCGYSGLGIDYNDEAGTAEQFAWDIDEIYCQP